MLTYKHEFQHKIKKKIVTIGVMILIEVTRIVINACFFMFQCQKYTSVVSFKNILGDILFDILETCSIIWIKSNEYHVFKSMHKTL